MGTGSEGASWEVIGSSGRRPLVLLHGLGNSREFWRPVADRLVVDRDCVLVDLPGFDQAEAGRRPPTPGDVVEPLVTLLSSLGLTGVDVAGHSLGGLVAVELANRLGSRRLTLVSGTLFSVLRLLRRPAGAVRKPRFASALAAQFAGAMIRGDGLSMRLATGSRAVRKVAFAPFVADAGGMSSERLRDAVSANPGGSSAIRAARLARSWSLSAAGRGSSYATDLVWGNRDELISSADVARAHEVFRVDRELCLQDTGHWPHVERPDDVAEFLAGA